MDNTPIDFSDVDVPIPALLRVARRTYGSAIKGALLTVGYDDMPHNGMYVLAGIANTGSSLEKLINQLGVTKQVASQLVDTLVIRGYLDRSPDVNDRRRMNVTLTKKGQKAASVSKTVVEGINAELEQEVGAQYVQHTKTVLAVLIDINDRRNGLPRGKR
jgi:DNA-binding MarR family transcriptional regulator